MTGVHAGLVQADADYAFMVPCDAPFLQPGVIRQLLGAWSPAVDVIVPLVGGYYEPLCAIYGKRCIPAIEAQLDRGNYRIYDLFDRVQVKTLDDEALRRADPEMISFLNINTPAALTASRRLVEKLESSQLTSDLIF
jgi:molybdopterin-guanine dinucleotide biosynthesis protein A